MVTNGHNSDDMPEMEGGSASDPREATRAGISNILALEQSSGLGYSFNAMQVMARMGMDPAEWMGLTEYTDREIQIMSLRDARRHRARYGNSRLDIVDWKKALRRVSRNRQGREEIERMYVADRQRGMMMQEQQNAAQRMLGTRANGDQNPMKLSG